MLASGAAAQIKEVSGLELPDLSHLVTECSNASDGKGHLDTIVGGLLDAYDAIKDFNVGASAGDAAACGEKVKAALAGVTRGYESLHESLGRDTRS